MRIEDMHEDQRAEEATEPQRTETMVDDPRTEPMGDDPRTEPMGDDPRTEPMGDDPRTETMADNPRTETMGDDPRTDETRAGETRAGERGPAGAQPATEQEAPLELFGRDDVNRFRTEWREVQAQFVDDPRAAVQGADQLVAEVMGSLTATFTDHKHELEGQWQQGSEAKTEDLRVALRRYRTFFNQLLNA